MNRLTNDFLNEWPDPPLTTPERMEQFVAVLVGALVWLVFGAVMVAAVS